MFGYHGLGEAIPIQLSINTPYQQVGTPGKFRVIGAPPGATIYWSSYKDGKATGELNASYGQVVEANGTAELEQTWREEDAGNWVKEILVQDAGGNNYTAMVQFAVLPESASTAGPAPAAEPGLLEKGFYVGTTFIPYWIPAAGAALWFFSKRR